VASLDHATPRPSTDRDDLDLLLADIEIAMGSTQQAQLRLERVPPTRPAQSPIGGPA
jgi:hypothetical protein